MADLLHISDLHFGPPFLPDRAEAVLRLARRLAPEAVVVTGDFTQRARRKQYAQAREFLARFRAPLAVVPGNHDVPLYRVAERFLAAHRNYKEYIRRELDTVLRVDGCTIVALNSTRRLTLTGGRLREWQLAFAARAFAEAPTRDLRVVATHHHLTAPPDGAGGKWMSGAERALAGLAEAGAEIVLTGHAHRAWVTPVEAGGAGERLAVVQCGTTTSSRGRGRERGANSLNVIGTRDDEIVVTHFLWRDEESDFRPAGEHRLARAPGRRPAGGGG